MTLDRIAETVGVAVADESKEMILAGLTPESVMKKIAELEATDAEKMWDKRRIGTPIIRNGRVAKFREPPSKKRRS